MALSAKRLGEKIGLTSQEMNFLLKFTLKKLI